MATRSTRGAKPARTKPRRTRKAGTPAAPDAHPFSVPPPGQLTPTASVVVRNGPFTVKAYRGDGCVLIAMDVVQTSCEGLAGFAIARSNDGTTFTYGLNRLSFDPAKAVDADTSTQQRQANAEPSNVAPYQKFRWVDYPPEEPVPQPITMASISPPSCS